MSRIDEIKEVRTQKLARLLAAGMNPFSARCGRTHTIEEVISSFERVEKEKRSITIAGRIMVVRGQGAIMFGVLDDGTNQIQVVFKKDVLNEAHDLFLETIDAGDFIEVTGTLFVTDRGQQSLLVEKWNILTKSLQPLPDKWHGITDPEERLRKRYLDLLLDTELRDIFYKKSLFWNTMRQFLRDRGFLEVETPTLEVTTGGAEANPFKTHHKDFDIDVYLRISVGELWQKRLMAGGFPKTFEIGRVYRNEGSSPEHLQEFTNMEFYWAYADYEMGMKLVQELYQHVAQQVFGTLTFTTRGHTFDLSGEWDRIDYREHVLQETGVDVLSATEEEMKQKLTELGVEYTGDNRERLTDTLWKYCRKKIAGPVFLVGHPKLVSPLAKVQEGNSLLTERFQVIIAGSEVGNGFSELNDPIDQRARFELQQKLIEGGDDEAMMPEWEFVEMLEHGIPPTCGFGCGERLFSFLVDKPIRETQLFPLVKPELE